MQGSIEARGLASCGLSTPQYSVSTLQNPSTELLNECASLFSENYGTWAHNHKRIRLSAARLQREYMFDSEKCRLYIARMANGTIVGYAVGCHFNVLNRGRVDWITQLVVDAKYRSVGIAKCLCRHALSLESFACGIVTSHPHAVRALESATMRRCDIGLAREYFQELIEQSGIPYVQGKRFVGPALIDTGFNVDHRELKKLYGASWSLGEILDGHEYFAFTFNQGLRPLATQDPMPKNI